MYFLGGIFVLVIMVMHLVWSEREEFLPLLKWCGDSSYGVEMFFFESQECCMSSSLLLEPGMSIPL